MKGEPTPPDQIPTVEEFKKLSLPEMLRRNPLLRVGDSEYSHRPLMPQLVLMDGAKLSVQASEHHYCTPRNNKGPYTEVEVGAVEFTPPFSWAEYRESEDSSVYPYIPLTLVLFTIASHGGIDIEKTFHNFEFKLR